MRKRSLMGLVAAVVTLTGGLYLTAVPAAAAGDTAASCLSQAVAVYNFVVENVCGGMTDCEFQCNADNSGLSSFSCSCG